MDTGTAMAGLKKAVTNLTDSGMPLDEALNSVIDSIKNASSETEALSIAQEVFGTKGAAEMTTAIREGRFSVDDLADSMANYGDVVETTYDTVMDSSDDATVAFNKIKNAGRELGEKILDTLVPILVTVAEKIQSVGDWFSSLSPQMQETIVKIAAIVAAVGPALIVVGQSRGKRWARSRRRSLPLRSLSAEWARRPTVWVRSLRRSPGRWESSWQRLLRSSPRSSSCTTKMRTSETRSTKSGRRSSPHSNR